MRPAVLAFLLLALLATPVHATSVAYIDGNEIWLASPDGSQRHRLSGPTADGREWRELAQADNGRVIATRRLGSQISQLNSFTLWGPDGAVVYGGTLTHQPGWSTYAYPVTLDLTADGRNAVYGYSQTSGIYPNMVLDTGTYVSFADRFPASEPFRIPGERNPTVAGARLVTASGATVRVQRTDNQPPWTMDFDPWIDVSPAGLELTRTDVAATGTVAAAELVEWTGGTRTTGKIAMIPLAGLGGELKPGDCFLPAQGVATHASLSQDGTLVAWHDDRGIVVAGVPDFSGAEPCVLTRAATVISATGRWPSLGPAALPSPTAPPPFPPAGGGAPDGGAPGGSAAPRATLSKRVKASALRRGLALKVRVAAAGPVTVVGRVRGAVVARGRGRAQRAGTVTIRVRATRTARKRLGRLRGKTLILRVTAGGGTATLRRTLR
jgi:hypothetical protein